MIAEFSNFSRICLNLLRMLKRFEFQVEKEFHKKRLDEFLFNTFDSLSKIYLRNVIKNKNCELNGYIANAGMRLKTNDFIEIEVDTDRETAMKPQPIEFEIVYEDREILVVNKPADLLVHPTHREKSGTLLNGLSYYLNKINNENKSKIEIIRPSLIHRLDRQTSGLILIAKTTKATRILAKYFKEKLVEKKYLAIVGGILEKDSGEINEPIGRFEEEKYWNVKPGGKSAHTRFRVLKKLENKTLLELEPVTGRTNQLRIHLAFIGHPIIGDTVYKGEKFPRLCLHASSLKFRHPSKNEKVEFQSELPSEIKSLLK